MPASLKFSDIRRDITAIACISAITITAGCGGDSTSSDAANSLPAKTIAATAAATAADQRARDLLSRMTLDQKIQQLENIPGVNPELQDENRPCDVQDIGRHIEGIPELGIPTVRFANGGTGVRGGDCTPEPTATALPASVAGAATFNPELNFAWGQVLGDEVRNWAHHALWGPGLNIIRTPYGGRNQEYMSEDPYLTGVIATQQVLGVQAAGKTHATIKHFAGNESEYQLERWTAASNIPARAMHEIYLLPFEMAIKDGKSAAVMCAFPYLNFHWACENSALLKQTLRERWGFDGYIVSDRRALHSTAPSILAGTGFELDADLKWYTPEAIKAAIEAGEITEADIDAVLRPRYMKMYLFGHFDQPLNSFLPTDLDAHDKIARQAADESIVLLKNDGLLPLKPDVLRVALIGADWFAGQASLPPRNGDPNEIVGVVAPHTITPQRGLMNTLQKLGSKASVTYSDGDTIADAEALAKQSDIVIVMVGTNPRETVDLETLSLPSINGTNQEMLVPRILAANPNTVVVLKTVGSVLMPWLPQARAVVEAFFPGQDDGDAVADVLFGVTNPSGKLPFTFGNTANEAAYETESQYPGVHVDNGLGGGRRGTEPAGLPQLVVTYSENLRVGYRWYEAQNVKPVFPFGHGLSYSTFEYSNLSVTPSQNGLTATYTITNNSARAGKEASQIYLTLPGEAGEPSKRLVGFNKVELQPGTSQQVSVTIDCSASNHPFSYFAPADDSNLEAWADGKWITPSGQFVVRVGTSSAVTPLESPVGLNLASCAANNGQAASVTDGPQ